MRRWKKFLGLGAGAATLAGVALAAVPGSNAWASSGVLTLCSYGGYASYVVFPGRGGLSTTIEPSGSCQSVYLGGSYNEEADVYDADTGQYIGSTIYNGSAGETIVTIGGPSFYAYNG